MRNQPKPLDEFDLRRQRVNADVLSDAMRSERIVTVEYVKRDGSASSSTGPVVFFNGQPGMDTGSVTIADENKGNRTVNLHRITVIK